MNPTVRRLWVVSALALCFGGCLVGSGDERCGKNQTFSNDACACDPGTVPTAAGYDCEPCGAHEVAEQGECVCEEGFSRLAADAPCEEAPEGLGQPCDPAANECPPEYPTCRAKTPDGDNFCTAECADNSDCEGSFICWVNGADHFCATPPEGQDMPCETDADCAGTEAEYCSITMLCRVRDCSEAAPCQGGWSCCDFSVVSAPFLCIPPESLDMGACPFGGTLIGGGQ